MKSWHTFCRSALGTSEAQATQDVDEEQLDIPEEEHEETRVSRGEDDRCTGEHSFRRSLLSLLWEIWTGTLGRTFRQGIHVSVLMYDVSMYSMFPSL